MYVNNESAVVADFAPGDRVHVSYWAMTEFVVRGYSRNGERVEVSTPDRSASGSCLPSELRHIDAQN